MKEAKLQAKQETVSAIVELLKNAQSAVLVDYKGLTVEEDTKLRSNFRAAGVEYKVLKNTMIRRAAAELGIEGLDEYLHGTTAVAFGMTDAAAPAKIIAEFIRTARKGEVKAGIVGTSVCDPAGVQALAELPSKEVLVAKMLGSMNAPISQFVGVLSATIRSLLFALNAVSEKKSA